MTGCILFDILPLTVLLGLTRCSCYPISSVKGLSAYGSEVCLAAIASASCIDACSAGFLTGQILACVWYDHMG